MSDSLGIEARVGARWWADKIRNGFKLDAGAEPGDLIESPMAQGLVGLLQERTAAQVTAEKVDQYERLLAAEIQAMLDRGESSYGTACLLGCDYGPGLAHRGPLEAAGLPANMAILPWKTTMWVRHGSVSVGDGYGAAPVELRLEMGLDA